MNENTADKYLETQCRMISLMEGLVETIHRVTDEQLRASLSMDVERLNQLRSDAEFLAMGPQWADYFMNENEWSAKDRTETLSRLFGEDS